MTCYSYLKKYKAKIPLKTLLVIRIRRTGVASGSAGFETGVAMCRIKGFPQDSILRFGAGGRERRKCRKRGEIPPGIEIAGREGRD